MTPCPSRRRTTLTAAVLLALALGAGACGGGDDPKVTDDPTGSASISETPSPTPTPTPTQAPLSPFEGKAPVKALRAWITAEAEAVNAKDGSMASLAPLSTTAGLALARDFGKDDVDHGYYLPGPHPFTPVNVQMKGATAQVSTCFMLRGWSERRASHAPVRARKIYPAVWVLVRTGGRWKVDKWYAGTADCHGVKVTKVRW